MKRTLLSPSDLGPDQSWLDLIMEADNGLNDTYFRLNRVCIEMYLSTRQKCSQVLAQRLLQTKDFLTSKREELPNFSRMSRWDFDAWRQTQAVSLARARNDYQREQRRMKRLRVRHEARQKQQREELRVRAALRRQNQESATEV